MTSRYKFLAILLLTVYSTNGTAADLRKDYSNAEIIKILKDDGYSAVKVAESENDQRMIEIRVNGSPYMMQVFDDGDLLLYYGMTGFNLTAESINTWNQQNRLSRAYLDSDNDPILEADLLANAGYSPEHLTEFLKVFVQMSLTFRNYLQQADQLDASSIVEMTETLTL